MDCYNIWNAQLNLKLQFVSSIHLKTIMFMQAKICENWQYVSPYIRGKKWYKVMAHL